MQLLPLDFVVVYCVTTRVKAKIQVWKMKYVYIEEKLSNNIFKLGKLGFWLLAGKMKE